MVAVNSCWPVSWLVCGFMVCVASQRKLSLKPNPKAEQLHIANYLCGTTQDVEENTKRVLFPMDQVCRHNFDCSVTFRFRQKYTIPLATNICVDFSRMQIHGTDTSLTIKDGSYGNQTQRLSDDRYPLIDPYMATVFCISKNLKLVLRFKTGCGRTLDESFHGWMYVYLETTHTGSIYFLDGMSKHRHRMGVTGQPRVSVRSYVWTDFIFDYTQLSMVRLSLGVQSLKTYKLCTTWNPFITQKVPLGVSFRLMKVYFNLEEPLSMFVVKDGGDTMSWGLSSPVCYDMKKIHELLFELSRDTSVALDPDWYERELLFELVVEVYNYEDFVPGSVDGETHFTYTTMVATTVKEEKMSSVFEFIWKIGLGLVGLILLSFCCYCCCRNECGDDSDGSGAQSCGQNAAVTDNMEGGQNYAMLPRTAPTAPQWTDGDGDIGAVEGTRYVDPPNTRADEDTRYVPPPSYKDLFPDVDAGGYGGR